MKMNPEKDDAFLASIARSLSRWTSVEFLLGWLFTVLADIENQKKARAVFDGIISLEIRLSIIDRLMAFEEIDELEAEMWARLSARISKLYKKRHELAHFGLGGSGPDETAKPEIVPFQTFDTFVSGTGRHLNREQIIERGEKFLELCGPLMWFITRAAHRRKPESPPPTGEEPPLVARLRELATRTLAEREQRPPPPSE